jgi:hypothetical protein
MPKTFTAPFAQSPKTATAVVTAAVGNLGTDAPTGTVLLMTAGTEGAIMTRLWAIPRATVTPSSLLLFISSDAGVTQRLKDSESMASQTVSTTAAIAETTFPNYSESRPLRLGAGDRLYVGTQVAQATGILFSAEYTDF